MGCFWLTTSCVMLNSLIPAAGPFFQQELIFPPQEKHVHSSCVVECPNGDLLCCWFYGSGERKSPDVVIMGARMKAGEKEWSEPWQLADTPGIPDCNPVLFVDAQQELWLFWIAVMAESWEDSLLRCKRAREYQEDGPPQWYWQDDLILKPGPEFANALKKGYEALGNTIPGLSTDFGAHVVSPAEQMVAAAHNLSKVQRGWMPRTHALTLPSGRVLLPLYSDGFYVGLMAISDDRGKSWRPSSPIPGALINQPSVVRKKNGELVAYMREEGDLFKRVLRSTSSDDGETWSVAAYTDIPNPNSSLEVLALADGRWLMVYNDSEMERDTLALSMSDDEGQSWKWTRHLDRKANCDYHYPSIIQSRDGRVHVTYTHSDEKGKSIKHVALDPDWVLTGD